MTEEEIKQYILEHPLEGKRKIAAACGITVGVAQNRLRKYREKAATVKPGTVKLRGAIDASEFIAKHDVPQMIRDVLALLDGKVIGDQNFRESLGINSTLWSRAKLLDEFLPYQRKVNGKLYWSTPEIFEELQKKMDIL